LEQTTDTCGAAEVAKAQIQEMSAVAQERAIHAVHKNKQKDSRLWRTEKASAKHAYHYTREFMQKMGKILPQVWKAEPLCKGVWVR